MESEVQSSRPKSKKRNIMLIFLAVFILLMLSATTIFAYMTLQNDNVYRGVRIGSLDASGMSRQDLKQALDAAYQSAVDSLEITLKTEKSELKAGYPELNIHYDSEAAVQSAYAVGRSGSIFDRFYAIAGVGINGVVLDMPLTFDEGKLDSFVNSFYDMTFVNVKEGSLLITDDAVTIRSGSHGENIDKAKTSELVMSLIKDHKGGIVEPEVIVTPPTKFNVDELYKQIISEPVDAVYKLENSILSLVPHTVGRQIDKTRLADITAELAQTENTERALPVTFTKPNVTSDMATSFLFKDELAAASTRFSIATENGRNRAHNMALAVAKINNLILAPGQEFSFNKVVGPRDLASGYKMAHVYSAGKIIDGVGGGICQVSSTMYYAILRADLLVNERRNHSFTVGYLPLGQDATAYYGGTDFRFTNSTKWPMKLIAAVSGNKISFSIKGTNDTPGKTVIISSKILKETPFEVKFTDEPTLPVGTTKEKQEGMKGYVVETYKTIKIDDKVVSQTKLHTSTYKAYAQEILRGTKPLDTANGTAASAPDTTAPEKPAASDGAVDPLDSAILDEAPPTAE